MPEPELVDRDAEAALVGAALLDYHVFTAFDIEPADFSDARWRMLWEAGQTLAEQEIQADTITLSDDVLEIIGGAAIIVRVMNSCPSVVRAGDYANIVRDKASQRRTLEIASLVARAAHKEPDVRHQLMRTALEQSQELILDEAGGGVGGWKVYTLADAYAPRDPLVYVIDDLFSLPSLSIVYGAPGCLKSMLLTDAALCVAGGLPWLPALPDAHQRVLPRPTVQVPTLWLDFDNGTRRTHERVDALARARDLDAEDTPFSYVSMPTPWLDGNDAMSIDTLIQLVNVMNVGLVVIDNLGVVSGDADENSAQMGQVLANFRRLAEGTGAAVVIIHHQRKSTGFNARAGESLRGHSSIEAAVDLALLIEREEGATEVLIHSTKTRGVDIIPFGAVFAYDHRENTTELARAQFYGQAVEDNRKPAQAKRAILEAIREAQDPLSKMALVRAAQVVRSDLGQNYLRGTIDLLASDGTLSMTIGSRNAQFYQLENDRVC